MSSATTDPAASKHEYAEIVTRLMGRGDVAAATAALSVLDDAEFAAVWDKLAGDGQSFDASALAELATGVLGSATPSRLDRIMPHLGQGRLAQIAAGRVLMRAKRTSDAYDRLRKAHRGGEETDAGLLLDLARLASDLGDASAGLGYLSQLQLSGLPWDSVARAHRLSGRLLRTASPGAQPLRVAVLAEQTPQYVIQALELALVQDGFAPTLYDGGYRQIEAQVLAPGSALYGAPLDAVVILPSALALDTGVYVSDPGAAADRVAQRWQGLIAALRARTSAPVILANYLPQPAAVIPNWQAARPEGGLGFIGEINRRLAADAGAGVIVLDVATALRAAGQLPVWRPGEYGLARIEIPLDSVGALAAKAAALISLATRGRGIKCVVTDLDNTLWGGVVGDAGSDGIVTGREGSGLAYFRYQKLLADLKSLGIVLAIASKNDAAVVEAAFAARSGDMAVGLQDFVVRRIDWTPKGGSIRAIAEELNIGLDAMLFIDDNPMEREQVRQTCPGVRVPVFPLDSDDLADRIAALPYLELLTVSKEDLRRHDMYLSREKMKQEAAAATGNYDEFLRGLAMQAVVEPLQASNAARVHQLVMKTNQFNLTTIRRTQAELEAMASDGRHVLLCARLFDRLDDHGLTNVMILRVEGRAAYIDTWLMSCRVFSRGFEVALLEHAMNSLRQCGVEEIIGAFRPTAKNKDFADLYTSLGFDRIAPAGDEARWRAEIASWRATAHHIRIVAAGEGQQKVPAA